MMQDVPPDLLNFEEAEELDPDVRLHQQEEDKRWIYYDLKCWDFITH